MVLVDGPVPVVASFSVNGAWNPKGNWTATPLTVAANASGAPATTVIGPVTATVFDWPAERTPLNNTAPVESLVAETQHSLDVADSASE